MTPPSDIQAGGLVSAVIPAYNAEATLGTAIESVLAQTHQPIECIVVDDGSTDATATVAHRYEPQVKVLEVKNGGVAAARNGGVEVARGEYVGFLDADDAWAPTKVERLLARLRESPGAGLAYCSLQMVDDEMQPLGVVRVPDPGDVARNALLAEGPVITAIFGLVPTTVLKAAGGFDERLSTGADTDLTCKIARAHEIVGIDEPLTLWRQHEGQMHRNPDLLRDDHLIILRRYLEGERPLTEYVPLRDRAYANLYLMLAIAYQREGRRRDFARYLGWALRRDPVRVARRLGELVLHQKLKPLLYDRWSRPSAS
jgi:glycosyltransferase involved in cell wall biosynthesis